MQERNGRYGDFHFCPNQATCGQKPLTKVNLESVNSFFRTKAIQGYQERKSKMSKSDKDAQFWWEGEHMMEDITFGELGGC